MNLADSLQQSGAIDAMAKELGVDSQTAKTAAGALLPAIVAGLGRNQVGAGGGGGTGAGGLADIIGGLTGAGAGAGQGAGALGGLGGILLDQVLNRDPTPTQPGNDILGQIFGNKDVSRGVADEVAGATGLGPDLLKKMLPMLAMAVVGMMMKRNTAPTGGQPAHGGAFGGPLGGILGQVVGGMLRR